MGEKEKSTKKELFSWVIAIVFGIVIAFVCREYVFSPVVVKGASMIPTYENKDVIIVSKISNIDRFDHVVFKAPYEDEYYIKRVIGLPGDTVEMKEDVLIVNGVEYEEPYVNRKTETPMQQRITENFTLEELTGENKVPEGFIFVLGDNRLKSADSRHYGLIPIDSILGESKLRIFPFQSIKLFW
ncbi:signal peptidase I [Ureibacillus massiliensis 4400831 = CIP 108448 = CCUG 49529]|uniref:Signal peptidase I n=1 Tax=Ureibacillus massiliensis 4400831 = CIP 108448 = CCUG 49529 TaxID=1211035 RepID=A0A0A3J2N3_9BACL|nr:signal peptidase I [Ureibacillus massiliensis]KGR89985.1 signal peptidase I [Ureibacillus massiliensis 4400831 = CIP 108448 = CCUG 49529]